MNLEGYQRKIARMHQKILPKTILYLPQLIGLAIGLAQNDLRLDLNLTITDRIRKKLDWLFSI